MLDICAGTCFTASDCMVLAQHKKLAQCEMDSEALNIAEPDPVFGSVFRLLMQR